MTSKRWVFSRWQNADNYFALKLLDVSCQN